MVDLGHPILFAKAIIIVAFIPIYTFQRVEGKIFSPVAFTLSFAMLGAIVLTMTLVPTLLAWTMKRHPMAEKHSVWLHHIQDWYRMVLLRAQEKRTLVMAGSAVILALTLALAPMLGSEFLPKLDEGNIWLTISLPPSSSLQKTEQIEHRVRAILQSYPEVGNIISHVGRPDDGTDPKGPNNMEILADLKPRSQWKFDDKESLIADMSAKIRTIPGVPTNFSQVIEDNVEEALSGVKGEIAVKVFGPDLEVLTQKSEQIASILRGIPGSADVAAVKIGGQSELDIVIDRDKTARLGINVADVNAAIQTALAGNVVNAYFEGDRRFDITVRLKESFRDSVDDIAALQVNLPGGAGTVALGDVARIDIRQGAGRISREAGVRNASVKANLLGPRPGQLRGRGATQGGRAGAVAAGLPDYLGRPVREPAARRQTARGHRADHGFSDFLVTVLGLPLGAQGASGAVDRAIYADRRHRRSGHRRTAFFRVRGSRIYRCRRHLGTERRHHGGTDRRHRAHQSIGILQRGRGRRVAAAPHPDDSLDGWFGLAAGRTVAWHRFGNTAPVCGGHRRRHRVGDDLYAIASAPVVSVFCRETPGEESNA